MDAGNEWVAYNVETANWIHEVGAVQLRCPYRDDG